jgi:DNA-binding NarL/FixJ family response regulator
VAVLLLTADLACSSQVSAAGVRSAVEVEVCMSTGRLLERAVETSPSLVIVDLNMRPLNCAELVPRLKALAGPVEVIAFGPHVHETQLAAAQDAGCDQVLPRGRFYAQIESILAGQSR